MIVYEILTKLKKWFVSWPSQRLIFLQCNRNEPAHYKTCAISVDSDQPVYPRSLIRVIADCMSLLQPPGYPKRDTREPLPYWVDVQADLCWLHKSYCRFCRALAEIIMYCLIFIMVVSVKFNENLTSKLLTIADQMICFLIVYYAV